jgi:hypothetical protein
VKHPRKIGKGESEDEGLLNAMVGDSGSSGTKALENGKPNAR